MISSIFNPFEVISTLASTRAKCPVNPLSPREVLDAYRLRHNYFVREKGWAAPSPCTPGLESDAYDPFCLHLAAFACASVNNGKRADANGNGHNAVNGASTHSSKSALNALNAPIRYATLHVDAKHPSTTPNGHRAPTAPNAGTNITAGRDIVPAVEQEDTRQTASPPEILAYLRALPWTPKAGWMLDREFSCLLSASEHASLIRDNALEISRLVVAPHLRTRAAIAQSRERSTPHPVELLLKALYQLSREQGIEHYYMVVETTWLKPFTRRFHLPLIPIGSPYTFPDGTETIAVYASLTHMEEHIKLHDPRRYHWYQER